MRRVKPNPANQLQRQLHAVEAERDTLRAERDAALARAEAAEAKVARVEALCALLDRVQLEQAQGFWWDDDLDDNDLSLASSSEIRAALDGPTGGSEPASCCCDGGAYFGPGENKMRHPFIVDSACPIHKPSPTGGTDG